MKTFIIKDIAFDTFWCGDAIGWNQNVRLADRFETHEAATKKIRFFDISVYSVIEVYSGK